MTVVFEADDQQSESSESSVEGPEEEDIVIPREPLEEDQELRLHIPGMTGFWTSSIETNFASKLSELPTHWLPPGTIRMLYHKFQLECQVKEASCSYGYFWNTFRSHWHNLLRFLPRSTHGTCDACAAFKSRFKKAITPADKFQNATAYRAHLDEVARDRDLEEFLQTATPLTTPGSPLCMHWVDGMS